MLPFSGLFGRIVKGLGKNSEALLLFGLSTVAIALVYMKVNEWLACGMPMALYIMYIVRQERSEKHAVAMAKHDLDKLEVTRAASLAQAYGKKMKPQGQIASSVPRARR